MSAPHLLRAALLLLCISPGASQVSLRRDRLRECALRSARLEAGCPAVGARSALEVDQDVALVQTELQVNVLQPAASAGVSEDVPGVSASQPEAPAAGAPAGAAQPAGASGAAAGGGEAVAPAAGASGGGAAVVESGVYVGSSEPLQAADAAVGGPAPVAAPPPPPDAGQAPALVDAGKAAQGGAAAAPKAEAGAGAPRTSLHTARKPQESPLQWWRAPSAPKDKKDNAIRPDRWFDSGRKKDRGKKARGKLSVGVLPKLDKWGQLSTPRRTRYYLPIGCLAFPGVIFALFHLHRSPWKPPNDSEELGNKGGFCSLPPRMPSKASQRSFTRSDKSSTRQPSTSLSSEKSFGADNDDLQTEDSASSVCKISSQPRLRRRKTEYGFVDKMFLKHWNRSFGENAQLTVRGAMLALVAGLPLILPETYIPCLQQFQRTGFWSVGAITLFIFTLWKTVGETLSYAWYGIFGTFMASIDIWIMFGLFPGGVSEVSEPIVFWVGIFNGVVFITVILWLNMDDNTKIFALMNFVWFWMAFMDPERSDVFSYRFGLVTGSAEVSSLLAAVSGSGLAVTATLLPFPLWALGKACRGSHETVSKLGLLWSHAVDSYCCPNSSAFETDRLVRELMDLHQQMDTIDEHLRNSWWECFGLGSWQRVRIMVGRLTVVCQDEFDRLYCVLNATLNTVKNNEDIEVFTELEDRIRDVISEAQWLLQRSATAACLGGFNLAEVEAMQRGIERVNEAVTTLTLDFREIKQEGGGPKLSEGLLDEHAFCYNLCALGRLAIKFTQDLLKVQQDSSLAHMPKIQESVGFWGVFDKAVLFDPFYLVYVVRTSLRILVCFFIGYHGYSNVVRGKNAGIAIPATLLLMRYTGSAIQKNAKRLQAVVLGTVTGILIHAIVGQCVWWGYVLTGFLYFMWLLLTLFMYFDAVDNSYSGLLMAYFGTMGILRGCNDISFDPMLTHYPITNTVVAIFVITFFDTVFHPGPAWMAAYEAYKEVWKTLEESVKDIFDPKVTRVEFHRDKIMSLVGTAASLGKEAAIEPRWWRIPWPTPIYDKVIQSSYQLCACLSNMERTVATAGRDGAAKDEVFQALLHVPAFQGLGNVLLAKMAQMDKLLKIFTHETTGPMAELDAPAMLVGYLNDESEARKKLIKEVSDMEAQGMAEAGGLSPTPTDLFSLERSPKEKDVRATLKRRLSYNFQVDSLEADPASQVSLLLSDIEQMIRTMRFMHHAILRG